MKQESKKAKEKPVKSHNVKKIIQPEKKKAKILKEKKVKQKVVKKVVNKKETKKVAEPKIAIIPQKMQAKLNKITSLHNEILKKLNEVSYTTSIRMRNSFDNVFLRINKLIFNNKLEINRPNRDIFENKIFYIKDLETNKSIQIYENNKIIKNKRNWSHCSDDCKLLFMTKEELNEEQQSEYNDILNKMYAKLTDFKKFINSKSWITTEIISKSSIEDAKLEDSQISKLQNIAQNYENIHSIYKVMPHTRASKVKQKFSGIVKTTATQIEFDNLMSDGKSVLFDISNGRYGKIYKVIKRENKKELTEVYLINQEGKIVKNYNTKFGLSSLFPGNGTHPLEFYSINEIQEKGIDKNLQNILKTLDEKMEAYNSYVQKNIEPQKKSGFYVKNKKD